MLKSGLCGYSDPYILVKRKIKSAGPEEEQQGKDKKEKRSNIKKLYTIL